MEALGYYGRQLLEHATTAATKANQQIEEPLFDAGQLHLSKVEKMIYNCLDKEPIHIEQIIADTNLTPGSVNAALISLQLKGLIKQLPGNLFIRK